MACCAIADSTMLAGAAQAALAPCLFDTPATATGMAGPALNSPREPCHEPCITALPAKTGNTGRATAGYPPSFVMTRVLNLALREILQRGDFQLLYGKCIAIRVTDVGLHVHFSVGRGGFSAISAHTAPDLAISATLGDFYLLATRKEYPDTLFFNRRLLVEGGTKLGLAAKNTLDGIELPTFFFPSPASLLEKLRNHMRGGVHSHSSLG